MKLLTEIIDINELFRLQVLLEKNGILIDIPNRNTATNMGFIYPARKFSIFVVYDEQYKDALALLENENHEVKNQIDISDYQKYKDSQEKRMTEKAFNIIMTITMFLVILGVSIYFYYKINA